jgi:ATP:cob(I)alamin adenosyltransferase
MLYTRKGDDGTSKLFDSPKGSRIPKSFIVFEALGTLDELNCVLGYAKVLCAKEKCSLPGNNGEVLYEQILENFQHNLFSLQGEIAGAPVAITKKHTDHLESVVRDVEDLLPPVKSFILPGGSQPGAYLDVARTIVRRAERQMVKVKDSGERIISDECLIYLNRLSSAVYALARFANYQQGYLERAPRYD